jgi:glycosyl transferase, family 25
MNYVINLKRSKSRREKFVENNPYFDFTFFDAIDGAELNQSCLQDANLFSPDLVYTKGAYGCALSHLSLWNLSIEKNQVITIVEDDAILRNDFEVKKKQHLTNIKRDWDIILWGWNFDHVLSLNIIPNISPIMMLFNQEQMRTSINFFKNETYESSLYPLDKTFGIPAYSINPSGARLFKENCFPLQPFDLDFPLMDRKIKNNGIDIAMNRIYSISNSFVCFPPIVITKNEHEISTVQDA